jgi:hypothetical protein
MCDGRAGVQFAAVIAWFHANLTQPIKWAAIHPVQWLGCFLLVGFGQVRVLQSVSSLSLLQLCLTNFW